MGVHRDSRLTPPSGWWPPTPPWTRHRPPRWPRCPHDGLARCISPVHTMLDGDTIFVLSCGDGSIRGELSAIGTAAARTVAQAVRRAVLMAEPAGGLPASPLAGRPGSRG
ncbi:MAG: P1 family peptidase [Bacillota bacterium]